MITGWKKIRVVASDMDGTFLDPHHLPLDATVEAAKKAENKGYHFLFATGRNRASAQNKVGKSFDLSKRSGIYLNGAIVYGSNGSLLSERAVDSKLTVRMSHVACFPFFRFIPFVTQAEVIQFAKTHSKCGINLCCGDDFFCCSERKVVMHLHNVYADPKPILLEGGYEAQNIRTVHLVCAHTPRSRHILSGLTQTQLVSQIHVLTKAEDQDAIYDDLVKITNKYGFLLSRNLPTDLAITHPKAHKADGLQSLCESLKFDMGSQALAIGDSGNDVTMVNTLSMHCPFFLCFSELPCARFI
jgi:hydroxymethylpyrimidine pyrophosphatase-like HAD family hydrolase